jgi:serine protease AprX
VNRPARARAKALRVLTPAACLAVLAAPAAVPPAAAAPGPQTPASASSDARIDPALLSTGARDASVIVQAAPDAGAAVEREVGRLGGRLTRALPLIDGFAATLPAGAVRSLAQHEGVRVLSADRAVRVQGSAGSGAGPLAPRVVRAPDAWSTGATGDEVTVALVDSGVADVPDLRERMVPVHDDSTGTTSSCYDLSGEGHCDDSYGHGTFMAGLIAGDGSAAGGQPTGVAPDARVLSVKVAGASGAADVSTVLAAIQWVVSFRERYDVRVLNLSLGTDSTQSWQDDPLNYAVERAWDSGVLVVVAAANTGPAAGTIAKPADDPWVVTVGAVDDRGTVGHGDDRVPNFSSRGPTREGIAKPDVVAPGAHVLSVRAVGSTLDEAFPPADPTSPYRTGSGTSMAAAVVSGVAAVALDAHPELTPDRLKHALRAAARPVASDDPSVVGAGLVDASATVSAPADGAANAGLGRSSGLGSLGDSRGSVVLRADDPLSTLLTGRQTAQLLLWDPLALTCGSWSPSTWYTSVHALAGWNTVQWSDTELVGQNWTGQNWTGQNWTGQNWTGQNWTGSSWYGEHEEESSYGRSGPGSASYGAWD